MSGGRDAGEPTIARFQNTRHVGRGPAAESHFDQGADDITHHVLQKASPDDVDQQEVVLSADRAPGDPTTGIAGGSVRRIGSFKRSEIAEADEGLGGAAYRGDIQTRGYMPRCPPFEG